MIKYILSFAIIIGLAITNIYAQNLSISSSGIDISNSSHIEIPGLNDNPYSHYIDITNNSSSTINVRVFKRDENIVSGTEALFCFNGACWPASTDTSGINGGTGFIFQPIDAGITTSGLNSIICEFKPNGLIGTSYVDYVVYDYYNMSDSVNVTVIYDLSIGIEGNLVSNSIVTYPNPADNAVNFKYKVDSENSKIEIYNIVGNLVESINLDSNSGINSINTSNYKQGAYFYSFIVNNKTVSTNKLIIVH